MFKIKKAITPVIALSLLLVVAVLSVVGFQGWFNNFSSTLFTDLELNTQNSQNQLDIETIIGETLYVNAGKNSSINSVIINGKICNVASGTYSGIQKFNISSCLENLSIKNPEILIESDSGLISEYVYYEDTSLIQSNSPNSLSGSYFLAMTGGPENELSLKTIKLQDGGFLSLIDNLNYDSEGVVVKFDSNGNYKWSKEFLTKDTWTYSSSYSDLISLSNGGFATGLTNRDYGHGSTDAIISTFNSVGIEQWTIAWGGANNEYLESIYETSDGSILLAGTTRSFNNTQGNSFFAKFNSSGSELWSKEVPIVGNGDKYNDIIELSDNSILITGQTSYFGNSSTDMFISKYSSSGNHIWSKILPTASLGYGNTILETSNNDILVGGSISSYGFISKFNSSGSELWSKTGISGPVYNIAELPNNKFLFLSNRQLGTIDENGTVLNSNILSYDISAGNLELISNDEVLIAGRITKLGTYKSMLLKVSVDGSCSGCSEISSNSLSLTDLPITEMDKNMSTIDIVTSDSFETIIESNIVINENNHYIFGDGHCIYNGKTVGNSLSKSFYTKSYDEISCAPYGEVRICSNEVLSGSNEIASCNYASFISTCFELQNMSLDLISSYQLQNNIDCSITSSWNGGLGFSPIGDNTNNFKGNFYGNNFTISNLFINRSTQDYIGLFGYSKGGIYNLIINGSFSHGKSKVGTLVGSFKPTVESMEEISINHGDVKGTTDTGGVTGYASGILMDNIYFTGVVIGTSDVGGLVGNGYTTNLKNSYFIGNVSGSWSVGGLVGHSYENIYNSYSEGIITGSGSRTGGLIGFGSPIINYSYSNAEVFGTSTHTGGLVGKSYSEIYNSYSTGRVNSSGTSTVGGLAGYAGAIYNSHSSSNVYASGSTKVGGLTGYAWGVFNSYATGNVIGNNNVGGLVGYTYEIFNSYALGNVTGNDNTGGLVGSGYDISTSFATGNVDSTGSTVGGLAGYGWDIRNSYANGNVTSPSGSTIGGLIGQGYHIYNSFSTGTVIGDNEVGGLVGRGGHNMTYSFTTSAVTGNTEVGGFIGDDESLYPVNYTGSYWNNNSNNPSIGVGDNASNTILTTISDDITYFYNSGNMPLLIWDSNIWNFSGTNFPTLK